MEAAMNESDPSYREPIPADADHMTMHEFVGLSISGLFSDEDGNGYYADKTGMTRLRIRPSDVNTLRFNAEFSHVVWFNR